MFRKNYYVLLLNDDGSIKYEKLCKTKIGQLMIVMNLKMKGATKWKMKTEKR